MDIEELDELNWNSDDPDTGYTEALDAISEANLQDCLAELEFQTWVFNTFPCEKP